MDRVKSGQMSNLVVHGIPPHPRRVHASVLWSIAKSVAEMNILVEEGEEVKCLWDCRSSLLIFIYCYLLEVVYPKSSVQTLICVLSTLVAPLA